MQRKLLIQWDPEIDGPFRRRFERALRELQVDYADVDEVDSDPDNAAARLLVATPGARASHRDTDVIVLLAGPGEARHANGALRLEASDIDNRTRRWTQTTERLGARLDRPGLAKFAEADSDPDALKSAALAFPADPLARDAAISLQPGVLQDKLASEMRRADTAEQTRDAAHRDLDAAVRAQKAAEHTLAGVRNEAALLGAKGEALAALVESTVFALASAPEKERPAVAAAREHAWRARIAAARASDAAERYPQALHWKGATTYAGETQNSQPHGHGVMIFRSGGKEVASYRGAFSHGHRDGHGVAISDGMTWTGQFANNEACGYGLLETPTARFEGEVAPRSDGAPRRVRGCTWDLSGAASPRVHQPAPPLLPKR